MTLALIEEDIAHGDGCKGATGDACGRVQGFHYFLRFDGGPQARHFGTTPEGLVHGFAQCCSGTLLPDTYSILSSSMLVDLIALEGEIQSLEKKTGQPVWERMILDPSSTLVTPFHAVIGQLMELRRGAKRHGSCGMGVGQTVFEKEAGRELTIRALFAGDGRRLLEDWQKQMEAFVARTKKEFPDLCDACDTSMAFFGRYLDASYLLGVYGDILQKAPCQITDTTAYVRELIKGGHDLFCEGAHGSLLDRKKGFSPFGTQLSTTCHRALQILEGTDARVEKMALLRAYAHRHGPGPLVTEDPFFAAKMEDENNAPNPWQGPMRYGPPDLVAWRYGLAINDGADTLAISCLDQLTGINLIRICTSYRYLGKTIAEHLNRFFTWDTCGNVTRITSILPLDTLTMEDHEIRTSIMTACKPLEWVEMPGWRQDIQSVRRLEDLPFEARRFLDFLQGPKGLHVPLSIVSVNPTWTGRIFC